MKSDLLKAKELLISGGYTCVFTKNGKSETSDIRGVRPLLLRLEKSDLSTFCAADRVVGAAAAFLYVLLKVEAVYALVISNRAKEIFERFGIEFYYDDICEYVINRSGDGKCPMEQAVSGIENPELALEAINKKLEALNKNI